MARTYDYHVIHDLLLQASRQTFIAVQQQHRLETFYVFGLYHDPAWAYILPTCNTEEGLIRQAHHDQNNAVYFKYSHLTIAELRHLLRWAVTDWAYHAALCQDYFSDVLRWLADYDPDELPEDEWLDDTQMRRVCRSVLRTLDQEGIFGEGEDRERVVLNVFMDDQDHSWMEHARLLNPPSVYARWVEDIQSPRY